MLSMLNHIHHWVELLIYYNNLYTQNFKFACLFMTTFLGGGGGEEECILLFFDDLLVNIFVWSVVFSWASWVFIFSCNLVPIY